MATIHYNTLNYELKKAIKTKSLSQEDLKTIYTKMKESNKKKKKTTNIVMIVVLVIFLLTGLPVIMQADDPKLTKFMITFFIPIYIIIYALVYITQFGIVKLQFNSIVKKNYPELADEIKL